MEEDAVGEAADGLITWFLSETSVKDQEIVDVNMAAVGRKKKDCRRLCQ